MEHNPIEQDSAPSEQGRLNIVPAGLSLILPGLGQLIQGRKAFAGHLLMYLPGLLILLLFFSGIADYWSLNGATMFRFEGTLQGFIVVLSLLFVLFLFPSILYSSLDAAVWQRGKRSPFERQLIRIGVLNGIIFVLMLVILPAISAAREAARRMQCSGNLKVIVVALHNYHEENQCYPPAYTVDENGKPLHSWRVILLPYMGFGELYDRIRLNEPWDSEYNKQFHYDVMSHQFRCPSSSRTNLTGRLLPRLTINVECCYSVVIGEETPFPGSRSTNMREIADGTGNTVLVVERVLPICWMDPNHEIQFDTAAKGVNCDCYGIGSPHPYGANLACADGAVRFYSDSIVPEAMRALLTKAGGEDVPP